MSINIRSHRSRAQQQGVGMVEVLVAMLLLAIGVLGFSILQVRAVEATYEAGNRSQAMLVLRGLAEEIRANSDSVGQSSYPAAVSGFNSSSAPTAPTSCNNVTTACSPTAMATWDAYQSALAANGLGIQINMTTCPGDTTSNRQCLLAAWGKSTPTIGTGSADCMQSTGSYNAAATCVMMEAY
ncbi:MAG: type IV pilus modification protein PilV [Gammaproteobacteria bacterium]|nr:type IV pilus modification protein PilV [Gammaproteobacteria bacterium]